MDKEEIIEALKELYEIALSRYDLSLCLEILQEIIDVKKLKEYMYTIE